MNWRVLALNCILLTATSHAQQGRETGVISSVQNTQNQRSAERFNILDWIFKNKTEVGRQNSQYGRGRGQGGPITDVMLQYFVDSGETKRDGVKLGKDSRSTGRVQAFLDNLISIGSKTRLINVDLGAEGFISQSTKFEPDVTSTQQQHSFSEMGGGLLIRPYGRSSQDTGLILKGGYTSWNETALWTTSNLPHSLYGVYLGAEAKLYLLSFLGGKVEYQNVLESDAPSLSGKWKMQRFIYGGFLELSLLQAGIYLIQTEMIFSNNSGGSTKEVYSGVGFSGLLHF